jgi:hypothetical protein
MRLRTLVIGFFCTLSLSAFADEDVAKRIIYNVFQLGGEVNVVEDTGKYTRMEIPDSVTIEVYKTDSIVVVMTACAPQCSSCARVYNKEWQLVRIITPPSPSIFPFAKIDPNSGQIIWTDNDKWEY